MAQPKHDRETNELAIQRILNGETTTVEMARDLELHYTTVRDWGRQYKKDGQNAFPGKGYLKRDDEEIRKLRKDLADLKKENAILKKRQSTSRKI